MQLRNPAATCDKFRHGQAWTVAVNDWLRAAGLSSASELPHYHPVIGQPVAPVAKFESAAVYSLREG